LETVNEEPEAAADEEASEPPSEIGPDDLQMLLLSTPERVSDIVSGLDEGRLRYRHGPAFPTAGEVATHVATAGIHLDAFLTAVCLETGAPPELGTVLHPPTPTEAPPLSELLPDWQRVRRRGVDLLRGLSAERWDTPIEDPEHGQVTLIEACRLVLRHEFGHLAQLRNLTALVPEAMPVPPPGVDGLNHG
jgi:hypothetical protein